MRHVEDVARLYELEALRRERDDLAHGVGVGLAEVFKPGLSYLLEAQLPVRRAVYALVIENAHAFARGGRQVPRNGERHVRLEGHEPPVRVREGYDSALGQEAAVVGIEVVLLKFAHAVGPVPVARAQRPEGVNKPLLPGEYVVHSDAASRS